jgi:hypothetical protein
VAEHDARATIKEFHDAVNMSVKGLEEWLKTDESKSVGQKEGGGESTGHEAGRHLVTLLQKDRADYHDDDLAEMRRVTGYIHRHLAQRPSGDITETRWRYPLKNWGHDPKR